MPAATLLTYVAMRALDMPLQPPNINVLSALALFGAFFAAALGEELGWTGYALEPMQARWSALEVGLHRCSPWLCSTHSPTRAASCSRTITTRASRGA